MRGAESIPGHQSVVLANGWRGVWAGLKGDQVFVKKTLGLAKSWVSREVCIHCQAGFPETWQV